MGDQAELYAAVPSAKPRRGFRMQRFVGRADSRPSDHTRPKPPRRLHSSRGLLRCSREPMPLFRCGQVAGLVCYWSHFVRRRGGRPTVYRGEFAISLGRKTSLKTNETRCKTCVEQSRHRGRLPRSTPASKATRRLPRTEISPNLRSQQRRRFTRSPQDRVRKGPWP